MEVLLGPMRPSVAGGRVDVPAEMRRDETNEKRKEKDIVFDKGGMTIRRGRGRGIEEKEIQTA